MTGDDILKMAYADPPYPGQAKRHYSDTEIDHRLLIEALCGEYTDGWALSTSAPALKDLLGMCPLDARVGIWVKPFASFKPGINPAYAWEPVIFWRGRPRTKEQPTIRDWVSANITIERGVHGAKPRKFCYWLFEMLNLQPDDQFDDLFHGSGAVTAAWEDWRQMSRGQMLWDFTSGGASHG